MEMMEKKFLRHFKNIKVFQIIKYQTISKNLISKKSIRKLILESISNNISVSKNSHHLNQERNESSKRVRKSNFRNPVWSRKSSFNSIPQSRKSFVSTSEESSDTEIENNSPKQKCIKTLCMPIKELQ